MNYIEASFELDPVLPAREILYAELADKGFEAFEDTENGVNAYIQKDQYIIGSLDDLIVSKMEFQNVKCVITEIEKQNWNSVWESNFEAITVNENCIIRAPFHDKENVLFDILISPQMSFGTGHHETTFLMANELFELDIKGNDVLDMGSGTGVLAIIAEKLGANSIRAIDIEEGAYLNAIENCQLNNTTRIIVEKGDSKLLAGSKFQVILANINKNILLQDIPEYSRCLVTGGKLLLSGFFTTDINELILAGEKSGLKFVAKKDKNNWALVMLEKI